MSSLLESTRNTRALPIGSMRYIRSDYPGNLSDDEVIWLLNHDITTIVDLREKKEYEARPCRLESEEGFVYHHLPVTGGGDTPKSPEAVFATYLGMLDQQMDLIIETIMTAETNVMYFCEAGKDRTGVVSAIILRKLGVSDDVIVDDYMKTKDNLIDFLRAYVDEHPEVDLKTIVPREENIKMVLKELKLYLSPSALTHIGTQTIETDRMILRRFSCSDNEAMRKNWISDEKIQSMYAEPVYTTKDEVKELLDKYISSYEKEDYYRWAIIDKESRECIGQIAYFLVDSKNHFAEIEYCIGSAFQHRGLATEATKAVIAYGFDRIHLHKVQICTKTINAASRKVIEKCGLTYEGTLRDYFYDNGQYIGRLFFSILREEYESRSMMSIKLCRPTKEYEE